MSKIATIWLTGSICVLAMGSNAYANTTNLTCTVANSEVTTLYDLVLDEDDSEVTYSNKETGQSAKKEAIFTADKVMWGSRGGVFETQFTVSRVDLSFSVEVIIGGESVDPASGSCEVIEAPKRAF